MSELIEIADLARVIAKLGPDTDAKLAQALEHLGVCRHQESLQAEVPALQHDAECYQKLRADVGQRMQRLIALATEHLPEARLHVLDAIDRDWGEVVAELHRIEDMSRRAALAGDDWVPIQKADSKRHFGADWDSVRKWKYFRWKDGETNRQALIHPDDFGRKSEAKRKQTE